jgi:DNA ligase-associated metallophosphoesterase
MLKPLLTPREIAFHGHRIELRPSGALYFPQNSILAVADLHLGKAMDHSTQGRYLPPYEIDATLKKLDSEAQATGAREILSLGDTFHSAGIAKEPALLPRLVGLMSRRAPIILVVGNHDRALALALDDICGGLHEEWRIGEAPENQVRLRHEPDAGDGAQIFGHFHPCATVLTRAGRQRRPCFIVGRNHLAMPSFGSLTGGLDVEGAALAPFSRDADLYMI